MMKKLSLFTVITFFAVVFIGLNAFEIKEDTPKAKKSSVTAKHQLSRYIMLQSGPDDCAACHTTPQPDDYDEGLVVHNSDAPGFESALDLFVDTHSYQEAMAKSVDRDKVQQLLSELNDDVYTRPMS